MAEGVLASLEKEFRPLLAPKLLAEAKAVQVVWARVKGYPAWPAQVLTEAAALRRKDLGQERHSKGNSIPVMFFGTVEVAWVKDADVVDFKEGLYQGFFDRKTKPFKLALEQVCEYLALDRKRKAPPKWWCRPPSNGHDDQSDGPSVKLASASGSGALKGTGQRQDASKASRQRSVAPETESGTSSDEDEASAARAAGKKAGSKPAGAKDAAAGRPAKDAAAAAPAAKPRDSSTGRLPRDNGSTAASTNTAAQAPPKKPPTAPLVAPSRQQALLKEAPSAGGAAKDGKEPRRGAATDAKEAPHSQTSQQQQPRLRSGTSATPSAKENDAGLPPRKRLKVESAPGAVGPMADSASNLPPPSLAAAKRTTSAGEDTGGLDAAATCEIDVLKLPAEIRRLAGIRLPAIPKKPGVKVELLQRQHPQVKAEQVVTSAATDGLAGASKPASVAGDGVGVEVRTARPSSTSTRAGKADGGRTSGAGQGKRSRRAQSSTGEDSQSAESTDDEDAEEEGQSSGEEADLEEAASSSSDDDDGSDDSEDEEESEDDTAVAAARRGGKGSGPALARDQGTRAKPQAHSQPSRDRKGERQRRLARLALPEPANRRTSSRLVPKAKSDPVTKKAVSVSANSEDESEEESEEGEDERVSSAASSSSEGDSDSEEEPAAKELGGSDDEGIKLRPRTRAAQAAVVRPRRHSAPATRNTAGGGASQVPSREVGEPADQRPKANASRAETDAGDDKKSQRREGSSAVAAPVPRALPLELRRLQNSPSAGPPAIDTTEPRTLRDRSSPARRAVGSTGVTPTQTVTAGANAGGKRVEKRGSEDGSGTSMSPAADRSRSPEPRRDGQKASAAEAMAPPKPSRSQALEGRSSKASSVAGSASPPPAPVPGGVPVRKKPPSLGVPSSARSTGQAGARQLPAITAITPARAVLRSLASTSDGVASGALPASACAGTSAAGTLLAPIAVCVPKKPSSGPPTRRLVEPCLDISSTDLLDVASVICEADTKHASSPDVAAADAVAASGGPLPRSPDAVSLDDVGLGTPDEGPSTRQDAEPAAGQPLELPLSEQQQEGALWGKGEDAPAAEGDVDAALADEPPAATDLQAGPAGNAVPVAEPVPAAEAIVAAKQLAEEPRRQEELIGLLDAAVTVELRPAEDPEPGATTMEQRDQIDPQRSSCCQQGCTMRAVPGPEHTEELPVLTARSSVVHDQEHEPASRSPVCPLEAALELYPVAAEQELPAQGPQAQAFSAPGSPVREDTLLAEEQLPDQGEAMAEHDGGAGQAPAETLATGCSGSGGDADPVSAEQGAALAASEAPLVPSMPSPVHAAAGPSPDGHATSAGGATLAQPSPQPPCAGSRANSEARGGDGAPAGASGTSCSVPIWGEDDDAAARARAAELEELGEVAAALAGLHQAEVPKVPLHRAASQPAPGQLPAAMQVDLLLDRGRSRGLRGSTRSAGSWEDLPVQISGSEEGFRWPQPEPILPSLDQPFSLPRDWLLTRPPRFEPVKRNIWLSRAKPKRLPKDEINICACRPPPFAAPGELQRMGCGPNCLNRLSSILCDSKLCPCGELCSNRSLHLLRQPKTEAFLTENRGWGVRAMEPLTKGAFIIEYAGEVIDERELGRRMDHARMNGEPHFYIMELSAGLYIDARRKGNSARLINSSCDPNCETQKWHDASTGEVRVGIFATRDIAPGEELVYDYFFSTYGAVKQSAASFVCMCGSKNCRGTMDLHPEKRRDLGRRVEVFWDADGQYYRAVIVAYHPTSKKHTVMYEDGGTEKLCLDEVPHRWMDDEPSRISPQKPAEPHGDGAAAAQPAAAELAQSLRASGSELQQQRPQAVSVTDLADAALLSDQTGDVPITAVASQPPPRPLVAIDQRCLLPPLASSSMEAVPVHSIGGRQQQLLGKHGQSDSELHLPLKKRPRIMHPQQISQPLQQHPAALPSPHSNTLSAACGKVGEAHPGFAAQQQASGGSAGCVAAPASGANRYSGGGADSAGGDAVGLSGRASLRHDSSGAGSGRVSSVAAEDDDPNEDLDSLLEAAEAVAALRTAPISTVTALHAQQQQQDAALPLQPRHVRSGSAGAGAVANVQTTMAVSPRHLTAAHRAGPPNGLPPHGGSRPSGTAAAHPSSSSSGFIPYQVGGSRQHASGYGNSHTAQGGGPHDGGPYDHHHPHLHHQHHSHGRNGRFSGEHDGGAGAAAAGGARGRNGNGYGSQPNGGDINREDLLWKLVGIDKPKDLLPLFSSGCDKSRSGGDKGRRTGSDSWIAPSHPYGKLLRALEASELLPQADQLRLYAQQHHQQQQEQQQQHAQQQQKRALPPTPPHPPAQLPAPAVAAQQPKQPPLASVASGSATAAEPQALSVWQQLAQQQAAHTQQQAAANGASYTAHGYDNGSVATTVAAFLQQQQAAAAAASSGQLYNLHALQSHGPHAATAAAGAGGGLSGHHAGQHALAAVAAASGASHWPQPMHGQPGSIIQDLVHMYVAQHAAGSHPMLAMAGTTTVGGPRV